MEVASPFTVPTGSSKRSLLYDDDDDIAMETTTRSSKRQRFSGNGFGTPTSSLRPSFRCNSAFGGTENTPNGKSVETPSWAQQQQHQQIVADLKRLVDQQAAEIEKLKGENDENQKRTSQMIAAFEKVSNENRILKKAVAIQQERQNQAVQEVERARHENAGANDRIRRLEQMNLQLRYQLQTTNISTNDFAGFGPRPPDVY
mmetsp:Transcript_24705/g.37035  ORF Transcript_24705/g.37035 Transcript_24705/m.37035 type:complete len:202 (-) Transcript_24705:158-763(-)|eukprot:CAMPEP_0116018390 /NCGR_PEP_ID=MMETSP0321-20121206/8618_1 /TAXON_ID=163516 /ORGANISM="Leptocylindrus danicus var. danicus, Strain B650" /LENGTH=201 /DNA_ID=CAMNT_0003488771 /DNA_START=428 /DNA_END=1033 /DNA_ORIENTATION=-